MAKKKKKSHESSATKNPIKEQPCLDFKSLLLCSEPKGKPADYPQILLAVEDASALDISNNDSVIVLVQGNGTVQASAICSARILDGRGESISSPSSKFRSPSKSTRGSTISSGSCNIIPYSLLERLMMSNQKETMTDDDINATFIQKAFSPQASPGSGFSFAKGGGGDVLISPTRKSPKSSEKQTPRRTRTESIWAVPTHNALGQSLLEKFGKAANSLSLRPLSDVPQNSLEVIRQLFYARFSQRFITANEMITISFQGKALKIAIDNVYSDTAEKSVEILADKMSQLRLENDTDALDLLMAVDNSLDDPVKASMITLFQISPVTEISMVAQNVVEQDKGLRNEPLVAGLDHLLSRIGSIVSTVLLQPEMFGEMKPPRGLLLHGPSGVGKTAVAKQLMINLLKDQTQFDVEFCHCASLQSHVGIVGESERMLSRLFERERKTLLILDDIHFICPQRGHVPAIDRLAATLLALLDGVESNNNIFLIGTTTDPAILDPALRRPGRIDEEVEVPIPDEKMREKILRMFFEQVKKENKAEIDITDENIKQLAILAKGFNGADCLLALKEATRIAFKASKTEPFVTTDLLKTVISSIKPSTISSISVEVPTVFWDSIGGMDDVKDKLREAIELPLKHADLFAKFNIPSPRGVLLYGMCICYMRNLLLDKKESYTKMIKPILQARPVVQRL